MSCFPGRIHPTDPNFQQQITQQQIGNQNVSEMLDETTISTNQNESKLFNKKSVLISSAMVFAISALFFGFTFLLRQNQNLLIPFALIFQSFAFLVLPTMIVSRHQKLKKFVLNEFSSTLDFVVLMKIKVLTFVKRKRNQTHPFVIVV
jgi:hypothetical protein